MSLIRVYLLVKTLVFRNEHFQLVFKLKTTLLKIRAQALMVLLSISTMKETPRRRITVKSFLNEISMKCELGGGRGSQRDAVYLG